MDFVVLTLILWVAILAIVIACLHFSDPVWSRTRRDFPEVALFSLVVAAVVSGVAMIIAIYVTVLAGQ